MLNATQDLCALFLLVVGLVRMYTYLSVLTQPHTYQHVLCKYIGIHTMAQTDIATAPAQITIISSSHPAPEFLHHCNTDE